MITTKELEQIRANLSGTINARTPRETGRRQILVCAGSGCTSAQSRAVLQRIKEEIAAQHADAALVMTGCFGLCAMGPVVVVYPEGTLYRRLKEDDCAEIVASHLCKGEIVARLAENGDQKVPFTNGPFFLKQRRVALQNCGKIDPENIDEYIAVGGYAAYQKAAQIGNAKVIETLLASGLRGRGGAGFPTGMKWQFCLDSQDDEKYIICNADEGDPGAFMDRSVLEGDPHAILEAMMIAGLTVGAKQGFIYVRAEYPVAVKRLEKAIRDARAYGLLGDNILGLNHSFDIALRLGAGAFVCGEETALLASVEGQRGEPRQRPPFPAQKGLFGKPTLINNVETLSLVPQIINKGAEWFKSIGTEKSSGTKVFALSGKINHTGLVEVPMGTPLRTIIEEIGGGIPGGKKFKAAQTGGPSGGCISAPLLDTPMDFESLGAIGSMMGSGGLIVLDEDNCMVDIAKFYLEFIVEESCGKCTPCRIGCARLKDILDKIIRGDGELDDINKLENLCLYIKESSLCGLGQTAPNPVLSTLRYFRDEYLAHIENKTCPAGVCKALLKVKIDPAKCVGCMLCKKVCPTDAIRGETRTPHVIDPLKCVKCGACIEKCPRKAIFKG